MVRLVFLLGPIDISVFTQYSRCYRIVILHTILASLLDTKEGLKRGHMARWARISALVWGSCRGSHEACTGAPAIPLSERRLGPRGIEHRQSDKLEWHYLVRVGPLCCVCGQPWAFCTSLLYRKLGLKTCSICHRQMCSSRRSSLRPFSQQPLLKAPSLLMAVQFVSNSI